MPNAHPKQIWKSRLTSPIRTYGYAGIHLLCEFVCNLPSQHVRRGLLRLFGVKLGRQSVIYGGCHLREPWKIQIGTGCSIGNGVELDGRGGLEICNNVNISSEAMLWTMQHDHRNRHFEVVTKKVTVQDYVWIGPRVIVLPGVTIAEGCVLGAGSVVTKSTEPYGIYAGIPARRVGERTRDLDYVPGARYTPFL